MPNWQSHWYRSTYTYLTVLLLPLSWIFFFLVRLRRFCYSRKLKKIYHFSVPVIVVGNITVGGTGKTPFVIWLAELLKKHHFRPGIVSRGVGGVAQHTPCWVVASSDPSVVGDEAIVLARRSDCPVVISIDRVAAVQELLAHTDCNVVISDDGLQHYRMGRTFEIALVDGMRGLGNGKMLPAGPLREPPKRLQEVDFVVVQGDVVEEVCRPALYRRDDINKSVMYLSGDLLVSLQDEHQKIPLHTFPHKTVHAVAALGNPERFFANLRKNGFQIIEHIFPDHHLYQATDLQFNDVYPIVMTEKDAVKCQGFADAKYWYLPVEAQLSKNLSGEILKEIV